LKYINKYICSKQQVLGSVSRGSNDGLGVDSLALVGDLGDVAVDVVGVVGNVLHTAVGKGNGVRSLNNTGAIVGLASVEVGLGVVIGDGVVVGVGGDLIRVHLGGVDNRGGMVSRGGVDNRGGMVDSVGNNRGVVGNSVVGNGVVGDRGVVEKGSVVGDSVVGNGVGNGVVSHGVVGHGDMGGVAEHDVLGGGEELGSGRGRGHEGEDSEGLELSRFFPCHIFSVKHNLGFKFHFLMYLLHFFYQIC